MQCSDTESDIQTISSEGSLENEEDWDPLSNSQFDFSQASDFVNNLDRTGFFVTQFTLVES
jgi:hypothetical protein